MRAFFGGLLALGVAAGSLTTLDLDRNQITDVGAGSMADTPGR